jgi:hypothetical protein
MNKLKKQIFNYDKITGKYFVKFLISVFKKISNYFI